MSPAPADPPSEPVRHAEPPAGGPPPALLRRRRWPWWIGGLLALLVIGLLAAYAGGRWLLTTEAGARRLLGWVPGLSVEAPSGSLLGDFSARRIEYLLPGDGLLRVDEPAWRGLGLRRLDGPGPLPAPLPRLQLVIERLSATRVLVTPGSAQPESAPTPAPESLTLPIAVELAELAVDEIALSDGSVAPLRGLRLGLTLADGAGQHELRGLQLAWDRFRLEGEARLGSAAPMPLQASARLHEVAAPAENAGPAPAPTSAGAPASAPSTGTGDGGSRLPQTPAALAHWQAQLQAQGPLHAFGAQLDLQAAAQSLQAEAEVTPFGALPVSTVKLHTERLDLAALLSGAPRTALTAELSARLDGGTRDAPRPIAETEVQLDLSLRNDAPGRWDAGQLPLRELQLQGRHPGDPSAAGELGRFDLRLGDVQHDGGRFSGVARWDGERWQLDSQLERLAPASLDPRAPPLLIGGPLLLQGRGPLPFGAAASGPAASGAPAPVSELEARATLEGRWVGPRTGAWIAPAQPIALQLEAQATPQRYSLRHARLGSSGSRLELSGQAEPRRDASGPSSGWKLDGRLDLQRFDPRPWSPAAAQALGDAATELNGQATVDLLLPGTAPAGDSLQAWLAAFRGAIDARIADSRLAGAPLGLELKLRDDAAQQRLRAEAQVDTAGNRLALTGELDTAHGDGRGDRWQLALQAPALAALEPLLKLASPDLRIAGQVQADARLQGRWPRLQTQGTLKAAQLDALGTTLDSADTRWNLGLSPDDPMELSAQLLALKTAGQTLERLDLGLEGQGSRHQLSVSGRLQPGEAAMAGAGATGGGQPSPASEFAGRRLQAELRAQGGWAGDATAGQLGWRGRVERLDVLPAQSGLPSPAMPGAGDAPVEPAPAAAAAAASATEVGVGAGSAAGPWLRAQPFDLAVGTGASGASLSVGATTLSVLDATLRLARLEWSAPPGQAGSIEMDAQLEPLAIAPLLARLQPGFGWGGDLQIAGSVSMRSSSSEGFVADAVLERRSGDLSVTDPALAAISVPVAPSASGPARTLDLGATQRLGLREGRIAFSARDGQWRFSQRISGRNLGEISGEQSVRAAASALWPAPDDPVQGELSIRVENLGVWAGWLPAGWRLGGSLETQAGVGGSFGAAAFTGRLRGSALNARNLILGVDVRDGELDLAMDGTSARIDRFVLHGSEGEVRVTGGATFGAEPSVDLEVVAERFAALARVDRRVVVSGRSSVTIGTQRLGAAGRFVVDQGLVDISQGDAPSLPDDVRLVGQAPEVEAESSRADGTPSDTKVDLDVRVDLGQDLRLRGRGIDTLLRGEVRLTSPNSRPALHGTIRTEGGLFAAYAQKLTIERGTVTFNGPIDNPQLDILALRARSPTAIDEEVTVGVQIIGPAQNPRIRLYSEPEMSDGDKLSWLVLGRDPTGLDRTELALVQQAALALLAGDDNTGGNPVLSRIGIDDLSVRQDDDSGVRETVVSLGKQLSSRWYVGYERSLNATTGTWQLIYRLARRITVRAQSGLDNSLDLIWTWRWQ